MPSSLSSRIRCQTPKTVSLTDACQWAKTRQDAPPTVAPLAKSCARAGHSARSHSAREASAAVGDSPPAPASARSRSALALSRQLRSSTRSSTRSSIKRSSRSLVPSQCSPQCSAVSKYSTPGRRSPAVQASAAAPRTASAGRKAPPTSASPGETTATRTTGPQRPPIEGEVPATSPTSPRAAPLQVSFGRGTQFAIHNSAREAVKLFLQLTEKKQQKQKSQCVVLISVCLPAHPCLGHETAKQYLAQTHL